MSGEKIKNSAQLRGCKQIKKIATIGVYFYDVFTNAEITTLWISKQKRKSPAQKHRWMKPELYHPSRQEINTQKRQKDTKIPKLSPSVHQKNILGDKNSHSQWIWMAYPPLYKSRHISYSKWRNNVSILHRQRHIIWQSEREKHVALAFPSSSKRKEKEELGGTKK